MKMLKQLQEKMHSALNLNQKILIRTVLFVFISLSNFSSFGDGKPCTAYMNWVISASNPLEINFISDGNFEPGSFSYTALWDFGDGNTSTDSCASHTYAQPGTYQVCLHATMCIGGGLCCTDSVCRPITVGQITILPELANTGIDVLLFPNPTSNMLNIVSTENFNFKIYNSTGSIVEEFKANSGQTTIYLEKYGAGLYYYYASDPSGNQVKCGKILVR